MVEKRLPVGKGVRINFISLVVVLPFMLFISGGGGGASGRSNVWKWIVFAEGSTTGTGGGRSSSIISGGVGGFWAYGSHSNVGLAIAVTAMAGLALAATIVYSRRGSLKSPWSRRRRKHALLPKQWKSLFRPDGKFTDGGVKFLKKVRSGGVDPSIRAEVWPFLLGVYDIDSSEEERDSIRTQKRKEYENLRKQCRRILKRSDESYKLKRTGGNSSNEGSGDFSQLLESPRSGDVVTARGSVSPEGESTVAEESDHPVHDPSPQPSKSNYSVHDSSPQPSKSDITVSSLGCQPSESDHPSRDSVNQLSDSDHSIQDSVDQPSDSDHPVHNPPTQSSDSLLEGDDKSGLTCENASDDDTVSSDSDSSEETENIILPFFATEGTSENDTDEHVAENSFPTQTESRPKSHTTEDFTTWQRIIRLDAVRANAEWIVYSPSQAAVSEIKAQRLAESVGLKDYDHLESCRIFHAARLVAILEAYALYDSEIGYCQGMSDLLSPLISMIEDDHEAFWCFVGFMRKARHNFRLDEVGIRRQLGVVSKIIKCKDSHLFKHLEKLQAEDCFFVYRMVVVLFRRELSFEQTLCLWEVMWADQAAIRAGIAKSAWGRIRLRAPPTDDLLLYAIAACVLQRRKLIIEKYSSMEEIMRECNCMAGHLDVWKLLDDAHDLVVTLHDKI